MAEWLAHQTSNHKIVGLSPTEATRLSKKSSRVGYGDDSGAPVHSAVNEYLAIDRDGNCT